MSGCSGTRTTAELQMDPSFEIADDGYQVRPAESTNQSNFMVEPNKKQPSNQTLNDLIRRLPGVNINDRGPYSKVTVTGMGESFISGTDPLFVVNGQSVGSDYATVYALVNPNDVVSMSVLKGSDASIYGSRGANGVIVIRTRK